MNTEVLSEYLKKYGDLSCSTIELIGQKLKSKVICSRDHFLHCGEKTNKLFYIDYCCARFYYITEEGKEITFNFTSGPTFFTSIQGFFSRRPSLFFIQAMNRMDYYEMDYNHYRELCLQVPELNCVTNEIIIKTYEKMQLRMMMLLHSSPLQKYQWLLMHYPNLVHEVPLHYIASFLGMTPETLSRIRAQLSLIS